MRCQGYAERVVQNFTKNNRSMDILSMDTMNTRCIHGHGLSQFQMKRQFSLAIPGSQS